ncbi:hypothetical protein FRC98_14295 [Lujinxingia vulgaris]|uniref:Tetratricopeptide repeat protein n=1 Tax=Lujinxingia vulgaris TaxID=2600176 RepID=A0A5C6X1Z2_9DELT|nr:tetratricopeptide repeat protein [Lujinxingia vulgaris]TXD35842.1 hypothetical protein FRC98_14295 [Lujinxingia vulgaris]
MSVWRWISTRGVVLAGAWLVAMSPAMAQESGSEAVEDAPAVSGVDAQVSEVEGEFAENGDRQNAYDAILAQGTEAYNGGDYEGARQRFVEAAQVLPQRPEAYRNLARANFWMERYAEATHHYDHYLRLAPEAADAEQIRSERRMAANQAGGEGYVVPGSQRQALEALERELNRGQALTASGGGAYGLYRTVLRMGYAAPELGSVQARLAQRLLDEHDARLLGEASGLVPTLTAADWAVQRERLQLASELSGDALLTDMVERRLMVVEAAEALVDGRYERAIRRAGEAAEANPDLRFVGWYRVAALAAGGQPAEALTALDQFRAQAGWDEATDARAGVLRAQLLQALGRYEEAARELEAALR